MVLQKNEYFWEVTIEAEDGHRVGQGYFSLRERADEFISRKQLRTATVVQVTLWHDGHGHYYRCDPKPVLVDAPTRADVLAKLTEADRQVLGLKD